MDHHWIPRIAVCLVLAALPPARAADVQSLDVSALIDNRLQVQSLTQAKPADDAMFLRRLSLDLIGRIPTVSEVYHYVDEDSDSNVTSLSSGCWIREPSIVRRLRYGVVFGCHKPIHQSTRRSPASLKPGCRRNFNNTRLTTNWCARS